MKTKGGINCGEFYDTATEVVTYYCLEYMVFRTRKKIGFGRIGTHARERYLEDLLVMQQIHDYRFASILYDYLSIACFCEASHAVRMTSFYSDSFIPFKAERSGRADRSLQFDPKSFLPECERIFTKYWKSSNYGGSSWGRIARTAQMRWSLNDHQFIDCVVDMAHNGGPCWGKGFLLASVESEWFIKFLDMKRTRTIGFWTYGPKRGRPYYWYNAYLPREIALMIERGNRIGIQIGMPRIKQRVSKQECLLNKPYEPVKWGTIPLGMIRECRHNTSVWENTREDVLDDIESSMAYKARDLLSQPAVIPVLPEDYEEKREELECQKRKAAEEQAAQMRQRRAEEKAQRQRTPLDSPTNTWTLVDGTTTTVSTSSSVWNMPLPPLKFLVPHPLVEKTLEEPGLEWAEVKECISDPAMVEQVGQKDPEHRKSKSL